MVKTFTSAQMDVSLSTHFKVSDFWSNPDYDSIKLDTDLANILEKFYVHFGVKPRLRNRYNGQSGTKYAPVASAGYRRPDWGGSRTSQHCYGKGLDFEIAGVPAYKLAQFAETLPEIGGIGLYLQDGQLDRETHIHIDCRIGPRKRWGWHGQTSDTNTPGFGGIPCIFRYGNRSAAIEEIQGYLNAHGHPCGEPDGAFGAKTKAALMAYQKAHGLKADGIYGKQTNALTKIFNW